MEKLEGMISDIVFKNEENGYTIAYLANEDEEVTIVGCMPTLSVGESIEVEGKWVTHKTYGSQFEVTSFMPVTPSSLEGIYAYLSSGMIHGIGEKMALRIIKKEGCESLNLCGMASYKRKYGSTITYVPRLFFRSHPYIITMDEILKKIYRQIQFYKRKLKGKI